MNSALTLLVGLFAGAISLLAVAEPVKPGRRDASPTPASKTKSGRAAARDSTPSATPQTKKSGTATPRSTPKGTPKATPRGTPAETPKATPKSTPRGTPKRATPAPSAEEETATPATAGTTPGATPRAESMGNGRAPAATLEPSELKEFASLPPRTQQLIRAALELTKLNLTYTYGSADPARGGMDCSGTMYHLLRGQGFPDVPRDSSSQYGWARKRAEFFAVIGKGAEGFEFDDLRPGDLLFWTGTYEVKREIPISHVMLYLGTETKTKRRVMFGASDGRSYAGIQRWGVSVFDFQMPRESNRDGTANRVDFVGYARIPGLSEKAVEAAPEPEKIATETAEPPAEATEPAAATTPRPVAKQKATPSQRRKKSAQ